MIEICTKTRGFTTSLKGDPRFDTYEDVLYVPIGYADGAPGIYDRGRRLVTAAGCFQGNPAVHPGVGGSFVSEIDPDRITEVITEPLIFGGHLEAHYGHFLTSSLSRFWWVPKRDRAERRILILNQESADCHFAYPHVSSYFAALNIGVQDFVAFPRPVRLASLTIPAASFEESNLSFEAFAELGNEIGSRIAPAERIDGLPPVYLSKSRLPSGINRFINEDRFAERLQHHGFKIIHPEELPIAEQIRLFKQHRIICGTNGSALHTSIFAPGNRLFILNYTDPPPDTDQHLIDKVNSNETTHLYSSTFFNTGRTENFHNNFILFDPVDAADNFASIVLRTSNSSIAQK